MIDYDSELAGYLGLFPYDETDAGYLGLFVVEEEQLEPEIKRGGSRRRVRYEEDEELLLLGVI
jgi:hypothetical protein